MSPLNFANDEDHEIENNQDMGEKRKSRRSLDDSIERVCFVCDKASDVSLPYNDGGVGRCSESSAEINMKHAKGMWLIEPNGECFDAAERLNIRLIGCDGDTFAADIYYHKVCYNQFVRILRRNKKELIDNDTQELEEKIISYFPSQVETKVLKDHNAYFLNQLCEDCKEISKEFGLDDSPTCLRMAYYKHTASHYAF